MNKKNDDFNERQPKIQASSKLVLSLIRKTNETKLKTQSISGELGEQIKEAVENKHLHAAALKLIARIVRMDAEKRDEFLRAFNLYHSYVKEAGLLGDEHVGDLLEGAPQVLTLGDVVDENVNRLKSGIKQAPSDIAAE